MAFKKSNGSTAFARNARISPLFRNNTMTGANPYFSFSVRTRPL